MTVEQTTRITRQDLKFFPSERLTDNEDGGGMPLGTAISGEANELFNPISSISRVNGAFHARLIYAGVQRTDDEPLIGAFSAITKPPADPTVSYLLFPATKFGETRAEILNRLEAYSVGTIESRMTLLSTQSQNSKIVQAYQRPGEPLPLVGDVYCLRQDKDGYPPHEQYIQVISVESEDRTFTNPKTEKNFIRTVVKLEISSKLEADFTGAEYPSEYYVDAPCKIRETHVADAAQYYGIKPLAQVAEKDSAKIKIPSLMEKLVPTNQIETALIDLSAGGRRDTLVDASKNGSDGIITLQVSRSYTAGNIMSIYIGNAALPGSVSINTSVGVINDDGGNLVRNDEAVGSIQYATGEILISNSSLTAFITSVGFRAAGADYQIADTKKINVDINNQSYNWSTNINPAPAPASMIVSYRAQGRWYDLKDDGSGALRGVSTAHGSGNVNFVSGSVQISCGELPDIGSAIIFSWGATARYFNRSGSGVKAQMALAISQRAVPSTLSLAWNDGEEKTAVSDARGNITGDWTGLYDAKSRQILINTDDDFNHPNGALDITVSYSTGDPVFKRIALSALNDTGQTSFTVPAVLPNSLSLSYLPILPNGYSTVDNNQLSFTITDDGAGNLINSENETVGTIDYQTGNGVFNPAKTVKLARPVYKAETTTSAPIGSGNSGGVGFIVPYRLSDYEYDDVVCTINPNGTDADIEYYDPNSETVATENLASSKIQIDLLPTFSEIITPSSVNFTWAGKTYFDRNGDIYTDLDVATGAATKVGSIDYQAGIATLSNWKWTNANQPYLNALATSIDANPVDSVTFRVPTSPLRAGSLQLRATALDGTQLTANASYSGDLSEDNINGFVDTAYGVVDVQFGSWIDAIGNESEAWYNADAVNSDGKIWRPTQVFAKSIVYNASAYSYLPVDSNIVKIDTVRLPQDGRIPIFRRGDTIIIGNRQTEDIGSAHTGGQTIQLSRGDLDRICVSDADGVAVNAELWDYDLDAGTITWTAPLDLSSYKMPLSVMHAQEERNRILQADIDGTLSLIFPLKRAYPIENTYVSSVLIGGDLEVRVSVPFTQRNWDNVWRDEPKGEQLLNKLNLKDYPMILTDDGAIKERWMIKMTSANQFELYGETLGFVGRYDTLTPLAPINPATNKPYFTLPHQAFGSEAPWASQDVIRFNTWGTLMPVWVLCAVQPSSSTPKGLDGYTMCLYGDTTEII